MQESSLRFGHVAAYDPARHMARVNFPDLGLTSYWLPVLTHNSLKNHDENHLDPGEHVACLMSGQGAEMGIVLGAFYDDKNTPPVAGQDVRAVTFSDGVRVSYDRARHELTVETPEYVSISAKTTTVNSETAAINSDSTAINSQTVAINAESFSLSGGAAGSAGITGRTVQMRGEKITMNGDTITMNGNIILDGNITLSGSVSCPGFCVDK